MQDGVVGLRWLCELGTLGGSRFDIHSWFLGSLSILWSFVILGRTRIPGVIVAFTGFVSSGLPCFSWKFRVMGSVEQSKERRML